MAKLLIPLLDISILKIIILIRKQLRPQKLLTIQPVKSKCENEHRKQQDRNHIVAFTHNLDENAELEKGKKCYCLSTHILNQLTRTVDFVFEQIEQQMTIDDITDNKVKQADENYKGNVDSDKPTNK